ncbi:MAG TPA: hypothetical protein VJ904_11475, partial [Tichowtungia sp.]|nr:hypothetical protein [Tichowtungia sp.]
QCLETRRLRFFGNLRDIHLHAEKAESTGFQTLESIRRLGAAAEANFSNAWKKLQGGLKQLHD